MSIGNIYNALSRLDDSIAADPEQLKNDVLPIMQKNLSNYLQSNPTNSINKIVDESGNTMLHRAILEKKVYLAQLLINNGAKNIENNSGLTPKILVENAALKGRISWEKSPPASSEKPRFSFSSPFSASSSSPSSSSSSSSSSKKNESTNNLKSFLDSLSGKGSSVNDSTKSKPAPQASSSSSKPSSAASSKADENFGKYFGQSPYGFGAPEKDSTKSKPAPQPSSSGSKPFVPSSADDIFAKFFGQNPFGFDEPAKDESESKMETEESQSPANKPSPSDERSRYLPAFREALERGNIEKAISIKDQCRSIILAEFENGQTALHIAAANGQVKMMEWLKHNGVDSTKKDRIGQTAVHKAAIKGHEDSVRFLIKRGQQHDSIDNAQCAPLHYIAKSGNLQLAKMLTLNYPQRPGLNINGLSPLDLAAENGHVAIVHYFLKHNIYKGSSFYSTKAIQLAAKNGHFGVVNMLLRFDRSSVEYFVKSSEYKEVCVKFPDEIAKLLGSGSSEDSMTFDYSTMQWLIENKESDQLITYIKERLKAGAYIDQADMEGYTCLQRAAKDDNLSLVKFLVEYANAEINDLSSAEGEHGYSPLHFAAKNGNDGMVQYLIWMGAAKEIKASNMLTTPAQLTSDSVIRGMLSKDRKTLSDERDCAFSV